jgi:succinate dehydrogenase / fumarate reductase cytochrome b subunit
MALTGLVGIGFVLFHMYGNLKAFQGADYFNEYSHALRELGHPVFGDLHLLWLFRIVLLASVVLHVWAALSLYLQNVKARPEKYAVRKRVQADYASVTMKYGGVAIFLFLLFHLAQLTWGVRAVHSDFVLGDPYHNVVAAFQSVPVTLLYLVALVALGFHLYHGTWSLLQTLGWLDQRWDRPIRALGLVLALVIPIGFSLVPISVQIGLIQ